MERIFLPALAVLLNLAVMGVADVVTLKNGEKVEGKILRENDTEVVVEVLVSASIKDERLIKKTDVLNIEKEQPDEKAWAVLKNFSLGQESLEATDYQRMTAQLNSFILEHRQSPHVGEAKVKLAQFQEEQKRVEGGEMKLDGNWLTPEQVKEERVQITGRVLLGRMKRHAAAGQLVEAMNAFDAIEKSAKGSASVPEAIVLASQVLPRLKDAAEQRKSQVKAQAEEMKRRLANTQGAERQQLEALQKQQTAQTDAFIASYDRSGLKWLPLAPATERSLTTLSSRASSEMSGLKRHNLERMKASLDAATRAAAAIAEEKVPDAEKAMTEASAAWSENEMIKRLQPKLAQLKTKMAEAAKTSAAGAEQQTGPTTKPKATPSPTPAPVAAAEPEPPPKEGSVFSKPAFWVILFVVLGLAAFAMKALGKLRDPNKNILDQ